MAHQAALVQDDVKLVDRVEARGDRADHQVRVAARADERVGAQEVVLGEVVAGRGELELVAGALGQLPPAPGRIDAQERELDVMAGGH